MNTGTRTGIGILVLFNVADLILSSIILSRGGTDSNALAQMTYDQSGLLGIIIGKTFVVSLASVLFYVAKRFGSVTSVPALHFMCGLVAGAVLVDVTTLLWLLR